jgi:ubiquinone/menaquinone biosynthesis C-methylase UbiE
MGGESDPYITGEADWWHLDAPSPELLEAWAEGWIRPGGGVLDLGCGLGSEVGFLAEQGLSCVGVDLSTAALRRAASRHGEVEFINADVLRLPFGPESFDVLLDRGCFHYLKIEERTGYAQEAGRVLRPGGRLLLRACLRSAGVGNDIDERVLSGVFKGWHFESMVRADIPSKSRRIEALVCRLEKSVRTSDVEEDVQDVAVVDDVALALGAQSTMAGLEP